MSIRLSEVELSEAKLIEVILSEVDIMCIWAMTIKRCQIERTSNRFFKDTLSEVDKNEFVMFKGRCFFIDYELCIIGSHP